MLIDGYFDMSVYISRIKKDDIKALLARTDSQYINLYKDPYPEPNAAYDFWNQKIRLQDDSNVTNELTIDEASAIVNWVYQTLKKQEERIELTKTLLSSIKEFYHIQQDIGYSKGVVYNQAKVRLNYIESLTDLNQYLNLKKPETQKLFFRGHANANYILQPSILRKHHWEQNESRMYNELIIECPDDFENCHTHLEKLVKMQHYGLPTRLLDITRNPLVALYFACESQHESCGEVIIIAVDENKIKYPQSDIVSILASLPGLSHEKICRLHKLVIENAVSNEEFNKQASMLIQEVRIEKPAFKPEINPKDIFDSYIVYALKNNKRIVKQDGAFILNGLTGDSNSLSKFYRVIDGKRDVLLVRDKKNILKELESLSINKATLFPEIERVSEYIKDKYFQSV